jgi:photosystem II P680 reaction center D1 protein
MHLFVGAVFGSSLFSAMHGSLVTSTLLSKTARHISIHVGQEDKTYTISAAHDYFGRLIFQYASFNNFSSLYFFLTGWPVINIWFIGPGVSTMAFNLNGLNFNESIIDPSGHLINSWADIMNRTDLGMELMHERNAHNFPLDLA